MRSMISQPMSHTSQHSSGNVIDTTARWLGENEDVVLGCESANPALQIERWGQEQDAPVAPLLF
jgi:hypothetical protein